MNGAGDDGKPPPRGDDREALREALAGVRPLRGGKKRAPQDAGAKATTTTARGSRPTTVLSVSRDLDDTVIAQRKGTHASILDTLGDPRLDVEARCDLHGMRTDEADRAVLRFVRQSQQSGKRWVLIIVGKGLHSADGRATLRDHVIGALSHRDAARYVLAFRTASRSHGGTGALVVRLVDRT